MRRGRRKRTTKTHTRLIEIQTWDGVYLQGECESRDYTDTQEAPTRVYSENDEDESENSDSKAEENKDDEADEVDENFIPAPRFLQGCG